MTLSTFFRLSTIWLAALTFAFVALTSCNALRGSADKEKAVRANGMFSVKVTPWFGEAVAVYASAYPLDAPTPAGPTASHRVDSSGVVGFVFPMGGRYGVRAYADLDGSARQDPGEPSGSVENLEPLSPTGSGPQYEPRVLTLPGQGVPPPKQKAQEDPLSRLSPSSATKVREATKKLQMLAPALPEPPLSTPPPP